MVLGLFFLGFVFVREDVPHDSTQWIGLALSLFGFAGVIWARHTLGRSFSIKAKATELVTNGIYSKIRNPIYVFGVIVIAGLILMLRYPVLWVALVISIPLQIIRARHEAHVLEAKFGEAYREYRRQTWF
jgi:protein-S-isoprenylcysteine O-methyltransferase Ste14